MCKKIVIRFLKFTVKDNGIGIEKNVQHKLFDPFFQANENIAENYRESGLGLSICKNSVTLLNGYISMNSDKNKGSEFSLFIPYMQEKQNDSKKT